MKNKQIQILFLLVLLLLAATMLELGLSITELFNF